MKPILFLGLLLLPVLGFSQVVDSVGVAKEVDSLIQVCRTLTENSNYDEAMQVIEVAKRKVVELFGIEHSKYAICLEQLAILYKNKGEFGKAEPLYLESLTIRGKVLGKESIDYASGLSNLAFFYKVKGEYAKAEPLYLESLTIVENVQGKENKVYANVLDGLAILYKVKGEYSKAEPLYLEALAVREKVLGKAHPIYAMSLNNLAILYRDKGEYDKAEPLYLEALAIREKVLGKAHPAYTSSLNNLANFYFVKGEYGKAESLYLEAKNIREKILGKEHPDYANSLHNLANLYLSKGDYDKAESLHLETKTIREKVLGKEHPEYAKSLISLANVYSDKGDYDKAELWNLESKAIWEKVVGKEHPDYANCLINLANVYRDKGDYDKAEPLYLEAKDIQEKVLGKKHPDYVVSCNNLAILYIAQNDVSIASTLFLENNQVLKDNIQKAATWNTEGEMLLLQEKYQEYFDAFLSFTQLHPKDTLLSTVFDNILFFGNALLDATIERENGIAKADSSTRSLYSDLKSANFQLNKWYNRLVGERDVGVVARLEEIARLAEKELIRRSPEFATARRVVQSREVRDALQPGEAAIEFIHYHYADKKTADSTMYAAMVLRPSDVVPQFIILFEEWELAPLLKGASGKAFTKINAMYSTQPGNQDQKSLYDLIWKPLEAQLEGVKTIYCSPSGLLHRLNLGAIPLDGGSETFSDRHKIILLGSTRQLVIPENTNRVNNDAQLFGGIRYTSDSTAISTANFNLERTRGLSSEALPFHSDSTVRGDSWNYLPETATEVRNIQHIFQSKNWQAQLDTGYFATEEAFRTLGNGKPSPRCLHIATHGFFFPDPKTTVNDRRRTLDRNEPVFKLSDHPMIRSGLILAGAQQAWSTGRPPEGREDGILTAYEISQMNLSNTELVVLSACETGLGDIEGNEGVYGLQRAFKIAGAKYLIMSLWKVSDQSSRELMTDFYQRWLDEGLAIPEAFRKAQANMKRKYPDAPYHWAGFVLVE